MDELSFNESEYLDANPDVAEAVRLGHFGSGRDHYDRYGKREGRMLSRLRRLLNKSSREEKVFHLLDEQGLGLEIGPSHNPIAPKKKGYNVHILDHASAEDLRKKYQLHNLNLDNIEEVDFVWRGEPFPELIGRDHCYDWIIASHLIEHVPDLVTFLQQCEALLKQDGVLSLVIPDKRYCFDYFSTISSTGSILDAYAERRIRPSQGQIFDHFANASKRSGNIAWERDGKGGADALAHTFEEAQAQWRRSVSSEEYIDVHCWRFTPASFSLVISDLQALGLVDLEIRAQFDTVGCEFYVSLGKKINDVDLLNRVVSLQNVKLESF